MADVFLAVRGGMEGFHKLVVIKRLRRELLGAAEGDRYRTLLLDEARLAARLSHPNIVQTFEVGEADGLPFLIMEYLDGQPLSDVFVQARHTGRMPPQELALQIVIEMLSGLAYAHDLTDFDGEGLQVIHRDVSPHNVFWSYDGTIKLLDFGVAKFSLSTDDTETGIVKGKLTYMAPEQALGRPIDHRADLFAVGIVMWELIAGRRLLYASSPAASLERLLYDELPSLSVVVPGIDPEVARICGRALERDLRARYTSAGEMRDDLERVMARRSPRRPNLAPFIQWMFRDERAVAAERIRGALAGHAGASRPSLLAAPSRGSAPAVEAADSSASMPIIEIVTGSTGSPARRPAAPRRWLVRITLSATIAALAVLLDRAPGDESSRRFASAAASAVLGVTAPAAAPLHGANTAGAELAPALTDEARDEAVARDADPGPVLEAAAPSAGEARAAGPTSYAALTAGAQRLSLDFRFRAGSDELDRRAARELDRIAQRLHDYPGARLLLLGFADAAGASAANLRLSQQRADAIAHALAQRGIHVASVEGLGAAMPVAPNATKADRERNRRVELWLEVAR